MSKQRRDIRKRDPTPPSLLIAAHCSTIRRKAKRLDTKELSAILDDLARELSNPTLRLPTYLHSLNEIVKILNSTVPPALLEISSHYFFILLRNTIRSLLQQLYISKQLHDQEIYVLRNCTLLLDHLVEKIPDVSKILHWITDTTFLDALANCLVHIKKISKKDQNKHAIKQITRLLNMFCTIQERLPLDLHENLFVKLLQPTIDCLTSSNYVKLFQNFQPNADSFTEDQKLILIKCPYFLTTYNGPHIEKAIEQILQIMLPRYVSILDKHMKTIKEWKRPIMRAIHNLIITIVYAEGYFSSHINTESFRSLINHLLNILNEPSLIKKIHPNSKNIETLLIDTTLVVFNVLVYESNALDYIKQRKPIEIFRQLTKTPYETIVLNAYMMLAYTMDDNDIKTSQDDLTQLLTTTWNLLRKAIQTQQQMNMDRNLIQLLETLKGLAQYEQIRNEILKQNILPFLIDSYSKLYGLSRQILLECLWKLSFNDRIAQQLREHSHFIQLLEDIPKPVHDNTPQNTIRRSNSYGSRRNSTSMVFVEATNYGIQKVADGLLWKIVKEPQFREKVIEKMKKPIESNVLGDQQKYKYDIMLSYCYADKDIVYEIEQLLINEGYRIWFDRDHNHGQVMESVAEAIKNSEFVIICMSDSYKRDNHCQAQAEYALVSKRFLLPLIVHSGYKLDGWLSSLLSNNIYIDFGISNFKTASELLLKEIKQRQHKKEIFDVKPTVSTPVNIVHNPSVPLPVSNRSYIHGESSTLSAATSSVGSSFPSTTVNSQQQTLTHSISRPLAPGANISATFAVADRQQQGSIHSTSRPTTPGSIHSTSRPTTPGSIYTVAPITIAKQQQQQQQQQAPQQPVSRSSTPWAAPSTTSAANIPLQQVLVHPVSRSSTPGSIISTTPVYDDKLQRQIPMPSIARSPMPNSISSATSIVVDKQQQQQQTAERPTLRSLTPSSVSSDPSVTTGIQRQQPSAHRVSEPPISSSSASITPTVIDKQQTSIRPVSRSVTPGTPAPAALIVADKQSPQESVPSNPQLPISASASSIAIKDLDKQQQQTAVHSITKTSTPDPMPPDTSVNIEKKQQPPTHPVARLLTNGTAPSTTYVAVDKMPPPEIRLVPRSPTPSSTSSDESVNDDKQHQQNVRGYPVSQTPMSTAVFPATSTVAVAQRQQQTAVQSNSKAIVPDPVPPVVPITDNKQQQQQASVYSTSQLPVRDYIPSTVSTTVDKPQRQTSLPSTPKSSIPATDFSAKSTDIEKQQQQSSSRSNSRSTTPASNSHATSIGIEKQQQQRAPSYSNSKSAAPAGLPVAPSINSMSLTSSQTNGREQSRLPDEYTNRKTNNSVYRTLSINAWRNNDVLDFLFDINLPTMMPLCESMSGKALLRLFRMCQKKPSRLYDQLNEELRARFKDLTLPMGIYTQFLIEMDASVGLLLDALPPAPEPTPKVVERVILMPRAIQQQPIAMQPSPRPTITSSNHSKTVTPVESISETITPRSTRIVERAVYRPASNMGRPYNFIIESVEDPTVILDQVQRYGNQLLLLDHTARQQHEINSLR